MRYIKNLLYITAILALLALGALLFPTSQAQAGAPCVIDIEKEATPSDGTEFDFTCTGGIGDTCDGFGNFSLMDGQSLPNPGIGLGDNPPNNVITAVELPPDGWALDDISCQVFFGNPNNISFDVNAVENAVVVSCLGGPVDALCTFSNVRACDVTIAKNAIPDDGTLFDFTAPGSSDPDFALTSGEEIDLKINLGENVDVTEILPPGWRIDEIECSIPEGVVISDIENGRNFACGPDGGSAECTFVNSNIRNIPTFSEWGLIALAGILGIIGLLAIRRRKAAA